MIFFRISHFHFELMYYYCRCSCVFSPISLISLSSITLIATAFDLLFQLFLLELSHYFLFITPTLFFIDFFSWCCHFRCIRRLWFFIIFAFIFWFRFDVHFHYDAMYYYYIDYAAFSLLFSLIFFRHTLQLSILSTLRRYFFLHFLLISICHAAAIDFFDAMRLSIHFDDIIFECYFHLLIIISSYYFRFSLAIIHYYFFFLLLSHSWYADFTLIIFADYFSFFHIFIIFDYWLFSMLHLLRDFFIAVILFRCAASRLFSSISLFSIISIIDYAIDYFLMPAIDIAFFDAISFSIWYFIIDSLFAQPILFCWLFFWCSITPLRYFFRHYRQLSFRWYDYFRHGGTIFDAIADDFDDILMLHFCWQ